MSLLNSEFKVSETICEDNKIYAAIDIGSTQTRTCIFTKKGARGTPILLDSNFEVISRNVDHIASSSSTVVSNLELVVSDITDGKDKFVFKEPTHILKGDLLNNVTNVRQVIASGISKIDQESTYINTVINTALAVLDWFSEVGRVQGTPLVKLTVSLPPEDTKYKKRVELFMSRLAGIYKVDFVRMGVSLTFEISVDSHVISEPEAASVFLTVSKQINEDDADAVVCVLDVGGRSTGITFIDNQALLADSCVTVPIGGSRLLSMIGRRIAIAHNLQEPSNTRLIKALLTGKFKIGAQTLDATEEVDAAKKEFAALIFSELMGALDLNGIQMQNISKIFCSGRTFAAQDNGESLVDILAQTCEPSSRFTQVNKVESEIPILTGLVYHGILYA